MATVQPAPSRAPREGAEPIPGYRLIAPLGQGGFGEVWKCEAPGGVHKAIKFVRNSPGEAGPATQELESLQRVKTLRHPFILSLDRLEVCGDVLLIIMELADHSLDELYRRYRDAAGAGVPREELLGYLVEAAEALDWMNFEHGLQHLDVKPHNLFLVSKHVKVADFGLVSSLGDDRAAEGRREGRRRGGVTPLYSAPELLRGSLSRHSDQYSLAVVYQQLLTGTAPFWRPDIYELMMQHLSAAPDLAALPEADRPVVARALSKVPEQRYPSCLEFLHALLRGREAVGPRSSGVWRRVLLGQRGEGASAPVPTERGPTHDQKTWIVPGPCEGPAADLQPTPPPLAHTPTPKLGALGRTSSSLEETARPVEKTPGENLAPAAPTAASLPGYRFLSCLNQGPLGDVWRAVDGAGRPRRALCLLNFVRYDARLIAHLQALRDPALPATEVHWSPAERLVILTEGFEQTLRDRFEQAQGEKKAPGLQREELLALMRSAAESLDALYARHGLQHLGLHPRNLLVDGSRLWVADFGVIPLVWLPTGQPAGPLNSRYAAPELFDRRPSRTADQYSLALIYAEMLTGAHPRPQRPGGSGLHPLPARGPTTATTRGGASNRGPRLDLNLLPASDRDVVLKALSPDPEKRYESCTAFIEALQKAGRPAAADLCHVLPPVIPYASLLGEPAAPDTVLPAVSQLVAELTNPPDPRRIQGPRNARYFVKADGSWEYRCPLPLYPGAMPLKVELFRQHWQARLVQQEGNRYHLHIDVEAPRGFWERRTKPARRLEVEVRADPLAESQTRLTEAAVRVRCTGNDREQTERILSAMAPKVFESARLLFQATREQRGRERWPLTAPLRIYPVLPNLELAEVVEGVCQDISLGGIRFRAEKRPAAEQLYLHLHSSPAALGYAIRARVARVQETAGGVEVGAEFPPGGPPVAR
jgi:serine/threonine protein kinase